MVTYAVEAALPRGGHVHGAAAARMRSVFYEGAKRVVDVVLAGAVLVALLPLLGLIAFLVHRAGGGGVIFAHRRIGRNGRPFDCLKFRTMVCDADRALSAHLEGSPEARAEWAATRKLQDDPRVLGLVGRVLRKTSLDELPQLVNVLRGDMSLVGPRPIVADELVHYADKSMWYLSVRPGLTGPWQIGGRSDTSYAERVSLDVHYAMFPSLLRDFRIMAGTARVLLTGRGAY